MSHAPRPGPETDPALESVLDRAEDRLRDAPEGLHELGEGASEAELCAAELVPSRSRALWERWNGLDLFHEDVHIHPLADIVARTQDAQDLGLLIEGDVVVAERGRQRFVLAGDPWAEGADVILLEEDGERCPCASSMEHLVLGLLGESTVLYDEEGEFQEDIFGEDGELEPEVERRLLRRRLDFDPDAPHTRLRLAQLLRRSGELRAAASELRAVLKRAPEYVWARFELGRAHFALGKMGVCESDFVRASKGDVDDGLRGVCLAWAARATKDAKRMAHAEAALTAYPSLVSAYEGGAREALEDEDYERARECIEVALAVRPTHIGLLELVGRLPAPA